MQMEILEHALLHTLEETVKLIPFLFLTYLAMEYLETKAGEKTVAALSRTGKKGPVVGALLGVLPQCGFSAAAASLYAGGVITGGTVVAVFLSTSDEMLPILISGQAGFSFIAGILLAKVAVGLIAGLLVNFLTKRRHEGAHRERHIHEICEKDHCHCEEGSIFQSALIHCANITVFIFAVLLAVHFLSEAASMETLVRAATKYPILCVFITGLVGLIPNCAVSVAITTLYLAGVLPLGSMFAGLLSCAGVGLAILYKVNRDWKQNVRITAAVYGVSVFAGLILQLLFG